MMSMMGKNFGIHITVVQFRPTKGAINCKILIFIQFIYFDSISGSKHLKAQDDCSILGIFQQLFKNTLQLSFDIQISV